MAKAQIHLLPAARNTVMVVDDQSTGRAILEQVVRSLDERVVVEGFARPGGRRGVGDAPRRRPGAGRLHDAGHGRHRAGRRLRSLPGYEHVPIVMVTGQDDKQGALRRAGRRDHRFPDQAGGRARMPGALPQPADAAPPAAGAGRPAAPARGHGRRGDARDPRTREGDAAAPGARRRVPRRGNRLPPDPHGALLAPDRQRDRPGARRGRDHRARGAAARHRQDRHSGRHPAQAGAAGRAASGAPCSATR